MKRVLRLFYKTLLVSRVFNNTKNIARGSVLNSRKVKLSQCYFTCVGKFVGNYDVNSNNIRITWT